MTKKDYIEKKTTDKILTMKIKLLSFEKMIEK